MKKLTRRVVHFKGFSVGLDVHKSFIQYSVFNADGDEVAHGRFDSNEGALRHFVETWKKKAGTVQFTLEACGCFLWIFDLLKTLAGREYVHVAQPAKLKMIANSQEKNDSNDAWWLAYLLYEGRLPEAFVAEGPVRELRIAVRELRDWTDRCSDLKRRLRSLLAQEGKKVPKGFLSSARKRNATRAVLREVKGARRLALSMLWKQLRQISRHIREWNELIRKLCQTLPAVQGMTRELPGFGLVVGSAVYAELGEPQRFYSQKAYAKATGLTPGYRQSGGKNISGPITRAGSRLARWALTRAVTSCLRCKQGPGLQIRKWVERRARYKPRKTVIVAAARKLAEGVWRLFALGEAFDLAKAFPR
jgi:transposase